VARHPTPSSHSLRIGAAILIAAIAEAAPAASSATVVTSAANIPYSGISPGGVNMATGELILVMRPDLRIDGPMPLVFRRYYASMLAREGLASGHLGPNWLGTYDWSLSVATPFVTIVTNRGQKIQFQQSPVGGWDLVSPTDEKYRLAFVGGVWRLTHPGLRTLFLFDGTSHLLTQILDEHGNSLHMSYSAGLLSQVSDGREHALTFSYGTSGFLTLVSDGTRSVSYAYTGGLLSGAMDAGGQTWTYAYSTASPIQGLLTGVMEPLGNSPLTQIYDPLGRVISQTDALSGLAIYSYDAPTGSLYTDPLANAWTYLHDSQNRLSTLTDPASEPTSFAYDPLGRPSMVTRPLGDMTSFAYDPASGYQSMVSFADGTAINQVYSTHLVAGATLFDLSTAGYPDGTTENYARDSAGNLMDFMDRGGFHWTGTYNSRGQILTATNPSSGVTTFTYDPQGRPATASDNAGNMSSFTYDALSRITQVTWPDATHRSYAYDNLDGLTSLTDERGKAWSYAYDANERLMTQTDPLSEGTGFVYDALDRVMQVVDPLGHATGYGYDPAGRLMSMTDRSGRTTGYHYDTVARLTGVSDPAAGTTIYSYDADSRVISAQDPLGHASSFGYDPLDRVTHVTDPVGTGFDYTYDGMGRLLTANAPLGHMKRFGYDPRGLLTSFFSAASETDYPRTPLGEVSQLTDPNRNAWPRGYDPQGRITSSADPLTRTTGYVYDTRSRVTHAELPLGSVNFTYDPGGRLTECQWLDGTTLTYAYDDANRLTAASGASFSYDPAGRMTSSNGFAMTYDNEGRILSETLAPGKVVTYSYESRGLLSEVEDWMGGMTSFTYDAAQRLMGITRPNGTSATYQYDAADRLINAVESNPGPPSTPPLASIAITRDALGQPTSIVRRQPLMPGATMPATNSFAYDAASQISGVSHDALGRTTGDAARTFQWDGASRLTHFTAGADSPQYAYDAFGQVLTSTQGNQTVRQVWNYGHNLPTNDDTQVSLPTPKTSYNVRTPSGLLLYGVDGTTGARSFHHYDESGNTIFLTNDGGSVTTEYAYTPYGGVSALGATADNPFTYGAAAGAIQLGSSGLFRVGGGIYDARTMRVISGNTTQSGPAPHLIGDPNQVGDPNIAYALAEASGLPVEELPARHQSPRGPWVISSPGSWVAVDNARQMPAGKLPGDAVVSGLRSGTSAGSAEPPGSWAAKDPSSANGYPEAAMDGSGGAEIGGQDFGSNGSLGETSISGMAEIVGNDAIDALDGPTWENGNPVDINCDDLIRQEAGTIAHELAHNLSLCHGGAFDPRMKYTHKYAIYGHSVRAPNFEPNDISVMNYDYQVGLIDAWSGGGEVLDYGRVKVQFHWDRRGKGDGSTSRCLWCPQ